VALIIGTPFYLVLVIWLTLRFYYFYFALIDRDCGAIKSLALSRDITRGNRLTLFGLMLVLIILNFGGLLACCIGVLFTGSFSMLCFSVSWLMMTGQPTADRFLASPGVSAMAPLADLPKESDIQSTTSETNPNDRNSNDPNV
jgi:hypothetical protein